MLTSAIQTFTLKAQNIIGPIDPGTVPSSGSSVINLIRTIFTLAFSIAGVATVALIIVGGFNILTSGGDSNKMKKGQDTLTSALIGLVIVVTSGLIFSFVAAKLGVEHLITVLDFGI